MKTGEEVTEKEARERRGEAERRLIEALPGKHFHFFNFSSKMGRARSWESEGRPLFVARRDLARNWKKNY